MTAAKPDPWELEKLSLHCEKPQSWGLYTACNCPPSLPTPENSALSSHTVDHFPGRLQILASLRVFQPMKGDRQCTTSEESSISTLKHAWPSSGYHFTAESLETKSRTDCVAQAGSRLDQTNGQPHKCLRRRTQRVIIFWIRKSQFRLLSHLYKMKLSHSGEKWQRKYLNKTQQVIITWPAKDKSVPTSVSPIQVEVVPHRWEMTAQVPE